MTACIILDCAFYNKTKQRVFVLFSFEYIPHFVSELLDLVLECLILCLFCLCEPSAFCLPTNKNESYVLLSKVSGMSFLDSVNSSTSFTSKKLSWFLPKLGQNKYHIDFDPLRRIQVATLAFKNSATKNKAIPHCNSSSSLE